MGALSPTHWLIIIAVLVVLFGAKRLPDAARSLGRSARILKAEVQEAGKDDTVDGMSPTSDGVPIVVDPGTPPSARTSA
jgi:sec-independent protein translocase protein TatA